ncbi:MAG: hypothetical protein ACI8V4_003111 [Ilumatobacter sp.]
MSKRRLRSWAEEFDDEATECTLTHGGRCRAIAGDVEEDLADVSATGFGKQRRQLGVERIEALSNDGFSEMECSVGSHRYHDTETW